MARHRKQSPEEQQFNDILKNASKSFKKDAEALYDNIEKQNKELKKLLEQRVNASKEDKKRIDDLIYKSQKSLGESFDALNSGVASFWEEWTDEEKKAYTERIDYIEEETKALNKTISKVKGELVSTIEDAEEAIKGQQKTLAETVNDFSEKMRNWADTFNLSAIKSSLEESVDSFVKNRRELESSLGEWFDPNKFSNVVSETVKDLGSYTRSEASEFISDLTKEFRFNSNEQMGQFSKEIAASTKAFDASISDYSHSLWRDVNGGYGGQLVKQINNLASEMSTSDQLNVKAVDIITKIDENIDSIFGAHSKNAKTQKNLLKSVASIEAIQSTAANTGISTLSDSILEWSKKSNLELMDDESFMTFSRLTGINWQQFQDIIKSGDVTQLYTRFQDAARGRYGSTESNTQANLTILAEQLGWNYSEVRDIADYDREELQKAAREALSQGTQAEEKTEQGISDAEEQENKLVGTVEAFKNDMTDFFKPVVDFFSGFDISLGEIASVITIGSTAAKAISGFLGVGGGIGGLKGLLSGLLGLGGGGGGLLGGLLGGGASAGAASGAGGILSGATGALGGVGGTVGGAATAGGGVLSSAVSGLGGLLSAGGPIAGGVWAVADSVNGLSNSVEWLGEEDGNSLSGKFASVLGGAVGGTDSGLKGGLKGAAKGALIGAFAGPVGMAVGGAIGAVAGAVGGEKIAKMAKTAFDFIGEVGGKFFSAVGGFAKAVGSGVKKVFTGIADFGHDVFENAVEGFDTLLRGTGKFAESIGKGIGSIAKGGGQLAKGIGKGIGSILGGFGAGAGRFAEGVGKGFGNVLDGVGDLAEGVGKGIGNIISAGGDLAKGIGEGFGAIISGAGDFAEGVGKGFGSVIEGLGGFAEGVGKGFGNILTSAGKGIKEIAEGIGSGIGSILTGAGEGLGAFAEGIGSGIGSIISAGGDLAEGIGKGLGSIVSATGDFAKGIGEGFGSILSGAGDVAQGIGSGIGSILSGTADLAEGIGKGVGNVFVGAGEGLSTFAQGIGKGIGSIFEGMGNFAQSVGEGVGTAFQGMGDFATGVGEGIGNIISATGDLAEGIGSGIGNVLSGGGELAQGIGEGIGSVWSGVGEGAGSFAEGIGSGIGNVLSGGGDFIGSVTEGVSNAVSGVVSTVLSGTGTIIESVGSVGTNFISTLSGEAYKWIFGDDSISLDLSGIEQTGNPIVDDLNYILVYTKYIAEHMGSGATSSEGSRRGGVVGLAQDFFDGLADLGGDIVDFFSPEESKGKRVKKIPIETTASGSSSAGGSFAEGSSFISNGGFAYLHEGEAVLTKDQANFVRDKADGGIDISEVLGNTFSGINSVFGFSKSYQSANSSEQFIKELVQSKLSGDSVTDQAVITQLADDIGMSYSALYDLVYKDDQQLSNVFSSISKQSQLAEQASTLDFKNINKVVENANEYFKDMNKGGSSGSGSILSKFIKKLFGNSATGKALQKMLNGQSGGGSFFSKLASKLGGLSNNSSGSGASSGSGSSGGSSGGSSSGGSSGGSSSGGTTALNGNSTTDKIFNYLKSKLGLNNAGAAGVLGNLERESGFRTTAVGDNGTSYGIVQWHNSRWTNLKNFAAQKGKDQSDLGLQLDFMKYELESNGWPGVLSDIKSVPNTLDGAKRAAEVWVRRYEMPGDIENEVIDRQNKASNWWKQYGSYAVGSPWIPDDQVALIHEGEMIVPADQNPMNSTTQSVPIASGNNNSEVIEVMKWQIYRLESKLDKLISTVASGNSRTKRDYSSEITDTGLAYASVRTQGTGFI